VSANDSVPLHSPRVQPLWNDLTARKGEPIMSFNRLQVVIRVAHPTAPTSVRDSSQLNQSSVHERSPNLVESTGHNPRSQSGYNGLVSRNAKRMQYSPPLCSVASSMHCYRCTCASNWWINLRWTYYAVEQTLLQSHHANRVCSAMCVHVLHDVLPTWAISYRMATGPQPYRPLLTARTR
jgi:hypothetical protein